ncbi:MAG: DUF1653 domain-containing protein [Anaerotruncus sp.]|nr:DUF1653 domain-containing protein [Anaerotruncus sp.]
MDWIRKAIFYHIYPLGFCGAPAQNNWDAPVMRIEKLVEWIPHLRSMNINALYLGPVFESSEHGYDTRDYFTIDRRLGDNATFKEVCRQLHENGIRIVLDGVFNHVGREFWAFRDVQEKKQGSAYCTWFHNLNFGGGSPMGDPFWYEGWSGHYNLVKLNLRNPQVVQHLLDAVGMWIDEFGIDGLRLDAADCVDLDFFRQLRGFVRSKRPDFWLMGEIIHGDYNRWANPDMLDSVTNYECRKGLYSSHNDHNYFEIAYSLNRQFGGNGGIYRGLCLYNFADNHDVHRLASVLKEPEHQKNIYTLLYTMPGVPSIYYGSEWGVKGMQQKGSDAQLRPCLELGRIPDADESLLRHLQKLGKIRAGLPALQFGGYDQCMVKNEQFAFRRTDGSNQAYVALNLAAHPEYVEFRVERSLLVDVFSGTRFETNDGNLKLELPAYGARILVPEADYAHLDNLEYCEAAAPVEKPEPVAAPRKLELGRYRHFKGGEYEVIGLARHSETLEELVVYRALYGQQELWVRPLEMFLGTVERDGQTLERFSYLG